MERTWTQTQIRFTVQCVDTGRTTFRRTADYLLSAVTLQEAPEGQDVRLELDQSSLSLADPHLEPHHYFHHLVGLLFIQHDRPALALTLARLGRRPRHNDLLLPLLTHGDRTGPSRWASLDSRRTGGLSYASQHVSQRSSCNRNGDLPADAEPPPAFPLCTYIQAVLRWAHFKHDFPCVLTQAVDVVTHIWQRVACVIITSAADSSWVRSCRDRCEAPQISADLSHTSHLSLMLIHLSISMKFRSACSLLAMLMFPLPHSHIPYAASNSVTSESRNQRLSEMRNCGQFGRRNMVISQRSPLYGLMSQALIIGPTNKMVDGHRLAEHVSDMLLSFMGKGILCFQHCALRELLLLIYLRVLSIKNTF
jgi:hypothetical protein